MVRLPGDDAPGGGVPRAAEVKAVRVEAAKLGWQDTAARLDRLAAALEKQQAQQGGDAG